jgi:hypothetical protein
LPGAETDCHHRQSNQNTSHPFSPCALGAHQDYHALRRNRDRTVSGCGCSSVDAATHSKRQLYRLPLALYTAFENNMGPRGKPSDYFQYTVAISLLFALWLQPALAQDAAQKPVEKPPAKTADKAAKPEKALNPAQIELLETKVRFESNGDSRKEVHALVKINSELGVRQFAKLNFDYNRSFESIGIPLVHITHASGGTADILPGAITDQPNPAVVNAPAYQDVRVKSVRILGLEPADTLEYRVITTVSHHPLAPDFWLDHTFDLTSVVTHEIFELDLPASRQFQMHINPKTPAGSEGKSGDGESARVLYRWDFDSKVSRDAPARDSSKTDVALTTISSWARLSKRMYQVSWPGFSTQLWYDVMKAANAPKEPVPPRTIYKFVSQKIATIDLPVDLSGYVRRSVDEILKSGYGTSLEKALLLSYAMTQNKGVGDVIVMYGRGTSLEDDLPRPTLLSGALASVHQRTRRVFLAIDVGEAPFGMIPVDLRGRKALVIGESSDDSNDCFLEIPNDLPFAANQRVMIDAAVTAGGDLRAKVRYAMRGDNELLLRVAFHQSPKEKWKELAQLLSITDGFRGQVTSVNASDPYATKEPFTLEYEIDQPKFVNWSKKTVRIPALLPQIGLPDPPTKPVAGAAVSAIELGTPLEVETQMTLRLPAGTAAHTPTGTSVQRDYATYVSQYSAKGTTITASRHINFLLREIPADRAADYSAFLHAVQNDEAQDFTLEQPTPAPPAPKQAEVKTQPPNKTEQPKP